MLTSDCSTFSGERFPFCQEIWFSFGFLNKPRKGRIQEERTSFPFSGTKGPSSRFFLIGSRAAWVEFHQGLDWSEKSFQFTLLLFSVPLETVCVHKGYAVKLLSECGFSWLPGTSAVRSSHFQHLHVQPWLLNFWLKSWAVIESY